MKMILIHFLKKIWNFIKSMIPILILVLVIRTFFIGLYRIPSGSMEPGLVVGDVLFASKYSYGYSRYNFFSPIRNILPEGRILNRQPERGDVIVFKTPNDRCKFSLKDSYKRQCRNFIKRIIGLPGDSIQIINGIIYINHNPVLTQRLKEQPYHLYDPNDEQTKYYYETLPEGRRYIQKDTIPNAQLDNTNLFIIPDGYYFYMGDNRDNSSDSRLPTPYGIGMVSKDNILAKARMIVYSADQKFNLFFPWTWKSFRIDRFFKSIK